MSTAAVAVEVFVLSLDGSTLGVPFGFRVRAESLTPGRASSQKEPKQQGGSLASPQHSNEPPSMCLI